MRKLMLLPILCFMAFTTKAQTGGYIKFNPVKRPTTTEPTSIPDYSEPVQRATYQLGSTSPSLNSSIVDAYYFDKYTKKPVKMKLKIVQNEHGLFVVGQKKLSDEYWTDKTTFPTRATKLYFRDELSNFFEYSAYILNEMVYF